MYPLSEIRNSAFTRQNGKCYYCKFGMWRDSAESFAKQYEISVNQAKFFQCTAEHLIARQDGGPDESWNIVAACYRCNQTRHRRKRPMNPKEYGAYVLSRLDEGKWHEANLASR